MNWPLRAVRGLIRAMGRLATSLRAWVLFLVGLIVTAVTYYVIASRATPMSVESYLQALVVEVAPQVAGQVVRVVVKENDRVRKGQLLFEIDPRPFERRIAQLEARLAWAIAEVAQLETDLSIARADDERVSAERDYSRVVRQQEESIFKNASTTERKFLDAMRQDKANRALLEQSRGKIKKVEQALAARAAGEHALIASVRAELELARLELLYCSVHASVDGIVTNLQLRVGAYAHKGQGMISLIDASQWLVIANYRETCFERMRIGQPALVSLRSRPGRLAPASVVSIGEGVSEGQGTPTGQLPTVKSPTGWLPPAQRFQVRLALLDLDDHLARVGATGVTTVYTEPNHWINPITRGYHQCLAWLDYLY